MNHLPLARAAVNLFSKASRPMVPTHPSIQRVCKGTTLSDLWYYLGSACYCGFSCGQ